jgi:mannose-6-phosphate isomerase-like protein (cupin superfamily)
MLELTGLSKSFAIFSGVEVQQSMLADISRIKVRDLQIEQDARGELVVVDIAAQVPFVVSRLFYVRKVPVGQPRGQHGHYRCSQFMVCQSGRMRIDVTDGNIERRLNLKVGQSILVEPGIFATETYLDDDSILLVLCDMPYDREDYIRSREDLVKFRREGSS